MDKYAVDRLNEDLRQAKEEGIIPGSVYAPVRLYLDKRSRELAPQTEIKEIREDIEGIQNVVSDDFNDDLDLQAMLAGVWCRLDELHGMVKI